MSKLFISYKEYGEIMERLVDTLYKIGMKTQNYIFSHVYGISRGGMPIATHLAHHMNLDFLYEISDWSMNVPLNGLNLLVVDDIVDTGRTFEDLSNELLSYADSCPTFNYKFLSIHYKPRSTFKPDIFYQEVNNSTWIVYPWECDEKCEIDRLDFQERRGITGPE